eukprot:gene29375-36419_t
MVKAFEVIITQLRGLSNYDKESSVGRQIIYILTMLSTVKSCVVPVMLAQNGVHGAEEVAISMFDAILSSVRADHHPDIIQHCGVILQACVEEMEDISQEVLDCLLFPLLASSQRDNPTAYKLIGTVLRKVSMIISKPVSVFLNSILVGSGVKASVKSSELADHIYPLVYELHKISPDLLARVIPNIVVQLQVEDEDIRLKAVQLLGRLFASPYANYAEEHGHSFREYLGRFNDLSVSIRKEVIRSSAAIGDLKPELNGRMEEPLCKRLRDSDAEIRLAALNRLMDIGLTRGPLALTVSSFSDMGDRAKDKKPDIRKAALTGLCRIYAAHVSGKLPGLSSLISSGVSTSSTSNKSKKTSSSASNNTQSDQHFSSDVTKSVDIDVLERLGFVPGMVVKSWGYPDLANRHLVLTLIQEHLLPSGNSGGSGAGKTDSTNTTSSSQSTSQGTEESQNDEDFHRTSSSSTHHKASACETRAASLLLMYALLETKEDKALFTSILSFKGRVRSALKGLLDARIAMRGSSGGASQATQPTSTSIDPSLAAASLKKHVALLTQLVPASDRKSAFFDKLLNIKDKIVFRLLADCVGTSDTVKQAITAREDLRRRLDSKSSAGEYITLLVDIACVGMVVNQTQIHSLTRFTSSLGVAESARLSTELLSVVSKSCPQTFPHSLPALSSWLHSVVNSEVGVKGKL